MQRKKRGPLLSPRWNQPPPLSLDFLSLSSRTSACSQEKGRSASCFWKTPCLSSNSQKQKAHLPSKQLPRAGPKDHQLNVIGKDKQNLGLQVHGTKVRITDEEMIGAFIGLGILPVPVMSTQFLGFRAALWGREDHFRWAVVETEAWREQPLRGGCS